MNTVDVLRGAKAILSDERNWTQNGALYRRRDDGGMSYCVYGAMGHVTTGEEIPGVSIANSPAAKAFQRAIGMQMVGSFNDSATHEEVIDAFDRAILSLSPSTAPERVEVPA